MIKASMVAAAAGFVLVELLVPAIKALCVRWRLYDRPGPLKIHTQPIPRLGGIAVAIAIVGGVVISTRFSVDRGLPLLAAIILICVVGAVDDIGGLSAATRLAAQVVAGAILWYAGGRLPVLGVGVAGLAASCIFTVVVVNAFNFIDGADGIAAGVAGIIAFFCAVLPGTPGDLLARTVAWTLAGSCAGFLLSNFPPAKIFLGDAGSTVLGLCIAFLSLSYWRSPSATGPRLLLPPVVAGLPLLDMAFAVMRRIRGRASPFFGDRRHVSDLLLRRGWSARAVATACYGVTIFFGLIGLIGLRAKPAVFLILAGSGLGVFLATAIRLGALQRDTERMAEETPKALAEIGR
jgi:UDP-GlcNAc:undecaprenyl-phosphate/decaprenyl-phosphate GlcNAc-1-phosphate transferase